MGFSLTNNLLLLFSFVPHKWADEKLKKRVGSKTTYIKNSGVRSQNKTE
jgi:hypothetical protein